MYFQGRVLGYGYIAFLQLLVKKAMECSFGSLKFVNAMYVGEGAKVPMPKLSENTHSGIRQVPGKGARAERD